MKQIITQIINNDKIANTFFKLFYRWQDEKEYEDINDYGETIVNAINENIEGKYKVTLIKATQRPFGVKVKINNRRFHFTIEKRKANINYIVLCAKEFS